jgi:GNAT superfamily N-acetyltransferase
MEKEYVNETTRVAVQAGPNNFESREGEGTMTNAEDPLSELIIRPIGMNDRDAWEQLWTGYLDFYEKTVPRGATDFTWNRLTTTYEMEGLLAVDDRGEALGLVQFLYHPSTNSIGGNCYLQDLFVIPSARRKRVGRRLIAAVVEAAKARQVAVVYWQTEEFNGTARRLYERVAKRSPFIRYQIDL